jgi:hypothetical protein
MGWLIVTLSAMCMTGCAGNGGPTTPRNVAIGESFELAPAQMALVGDTGLTLTFDRVADDSRCAVDVQCIWEGDALVVVTAAQPGREAARLDLHTTASGGGGPREARYGEFLVTLSALAPQPHSRAPIEAGDYRATLRVTR